MPHRNLNDIARLDESLKQATNHKKWKHIILAGDFNCPDINWERMSVNKDAADREVQQALLDLTIEHGLSQVHDQQTRDNNLLELVFTNNPSIVKTSSSVPGISDHAMVVTDIDIIPQHVKQKLRKLFIFSKANWRKSRLYKHAKKSKQWALSRLSRRHARRHSRRPKSATSTLSYRRDLLKTTLNPFGVMSNPGVKIALVSHR